MVGDRVLTQKALASILNVSERTLERWRSENQGPPYVRLVKGGVVRYREADVAAWLEAALERSRERWRGQAAKLATTGIGTSQRSVRKAQRPNPTRASAPTTLCANLGGDAAETKSTAAGSNSPKALISSHATREPISDGLVRKDDERTSAGPLYRKAASAPDGWASYAELLWI